MCCEVEERKKCSIFTQKLVYLFMRETCRDEAKAFPFLMYDELGYTQFPANIDSLIANRCILCNGFKV